MLQFYLRFWCRTEGAGPFCGGAATIRQVLQRGWQLFAANPDARRAYQAPSLITGHSVPASASAAWGGRTIRPSEWANIFIMDESCF